MSGVASTPDVAPHFSAAPRALEEPRKNALVLGLPFVLVAMAVSIGLERVWGPHGWWVPGDFWLSVHASLYVANGALGYLYEVAEGITSLPLFFIVLAPLSLLGQELGLLPSLPQLILRPTMWLLLGPAVLAISIPMLHSTAALLRKVAAPGRPVVTGLLFLGLVFFPIAWPLGHFEDALALTCALAATRLLFSGRPVAGGLVFSAAIAFKQWALLGLPIYLVLTPRHLRLRTLGASLALPGILAAFVLALDWDHAAPSLLAARNFPALGHAPPWIPIGGKFDGVAVAPYRGMVFVVPVVLAWILRRGAEPGQTFAALGVAYLSRSLFEPVVHVYYLVPALAFFLLHERVSTKGHWRSAVLGLAIILFFRAPQSPVWWPGFVLAAVALAWPALRDVGALIRPTPVRTSPHRAP